LAPSIYSQEIRLYLDFEQQRLSANIRNMPLKAVFDEITEKRGICFETSYVRDSSSLDEKISVRFTDLPVQDGLKRILAGMNYCIIFNGESVVGVTLFGKAGTRRYSKKRRTSPRYRKLR
jgi:hypothetical protein